MFHRAMGLINQVGERRETAHFKAELTWK
jgi:hypothetical protein